ncbi:SnoaL-like domain [Pannonibacter phragmitetus]|uniref:SnoaL-like domain n=1 Tax=Pannonibacter phragmitetus TaxID=121719 RepID=A0A378ZU55_9HYPH|nr:nuclear transport factor 2 family protein [Pannonibacter phragmitetus]SUB00349.1 SnoaL-like domain [Pannonibacter phragmitetus]
MEMPGIVKAFFDADSRNDAEALSNAFAADAVVQDEGAHHKGRTAIRSWWSAAKAASQFVAEPFEAKSGDGKAFVRAKVSGDFPGSPLTLSYAFTLWDGEIAALEITA